MSLKGPLQPAQLEVLRWVSDGCPDGRWQGHSYKTTANALAGRRLIAVSKKSGVWNAAILPAGAHYLDHGEYPPGHWKTKRSGTARSTQADRPASSTRAPAVAKKEPQPRPRRPASASGELRPTQKLLRDVMNAGGRLVLDVFDDPTNYSHLVGIINARGLAPDDNQLLVTRQSGNRLEIRLASVSDWTTQQPTEVAEPSRSKKSHAAVAALREDGVCSAITPVATRARAFRMLNALAWEASARGIAVSAVKRDRHGFRQDSHHLNGDLIFSLDRVRCAVTVVQLSDKVPHKATAAESAHKRRNAHAYIPEYDYVPSPRLQIIADTDARYGSKRRWSDTKALSLELRLPDVLDALLGWDESEKQHEERARRAEIERRQRRELEDAAATEAYYQQSRANRLLNDFDAWDTHRRMGVFVDEMARRAAQIVEDGEREAARGWVEWCRKYVTELDPFARPVRMPSPAPPTYVDLIEFRRRLGFTP